MATYEPNPKHKYPKGHGTRCQRGVSLEHALELLERAVEADPDGSGKVRRRYAVCGSVVFQAKRHDPGGNAESRWHGFPVRGREVPRYVLNRMVERGDVSQGLARRLRYQRSIPEVCGCSS